MKITFDGREQPLALWARELDFTPKQFYRTRRANPELSLQAALVACALRAQVFKEKGQQSREAWQRLTKRAIKVANSLS